MIGPRGMPGGGFGVLRVVPAGLATGPGGLLATDRGRHVLARAAFPTTPATR